MDRAVVITGYRDALKEHAKTDGKLKECKSLARGFCRFLVELIY